MGGGGPDGAGGMQAGGMRAGCGRAGCTRRCACEFRCAIKRAALVLPEEHWIGAGEGEDSDSISTSDSSSSSDDEEEEETTNSLTPEQKQKDAETVPMEVVRKVIRRMHVALGHASIPDMTRILRDGGGSQMAFQALKEFACEICVGIWEKPTNAPRRVSTTLDRILSTSVAMDVKLHQGWEKGTGVKIFHIIDLASKYHMANPLTK